MALNVHTAFMLLICVGLLLFQANEVCGSKNADLVFKEGRRVQPEMVKNRRTLNFGKVLQYAKGALKSNKPSFPSLIYCLLVSQGFARNLDEGLSDVSDLLKIVVALMKGNCKVDLPWGEQGMTTSTTTTPPTETIPTENYVMLFPSILQAQIDFNLKQITNAKELITHYEAQIVEYRLLLDVTIHSGQKVGVNGAQTQTNEAGTSGSEGGIDEEKDSAG